MIKPKLPHRLLNLFTRLNICSVKDKGFLNGKLNGDKGLWGKLLKMFLVFSPGQFKRG